MCRIRYIIFLFFVICSGVFVHAQKAKVLPEKQKIEFDRYYFDGMRDKITQNYSDAESAFRQALQINQSSADAHFQLSTVLLMQKKVDEAFQESNKAFELNPSNEWYARFYIDLCKKNHDFKAAVDACKIAYKANGNTYFLFELQNFYMALKMPGKAISALNEIEKKDGVTEKVSLVKEDIHLKSGDLNSAIKEIEKLCKKFPETDQYQGMLADLYMRKGKVNEALDIYHVILKKDPKSGLASLSLAEYYAESGDTLQYYMSLKTAMESNLSAGVKMQVMMQIIPSGYFFPDHNQKCKELTQAFSGSNPTAYEPYLLMGDLELINKNTTAARESYLLAVQYNPSVIASWDQLMMCDQTMRKYDWMFDDAGKMLESFPDYGNAYLYYGYACRQLKKYNEGLSKIREGLEYAKDEETLILLLSNLGDISHYANNYELSDSCYEAILAMNPGNSLALNNYAYFLSLRNTDLDKAANLSKKSLQIDPNNASYLDTYGWILYQQGKYEDALEYIGKSFENSPESAEVMEHLGDVYYKLGKTDNALNYWNKALQAGSESRDLKYKIENKKMP